jgi:hypothetical protein
MDWDKVDVDNITDLESEDLAPWEHDHYARVKIQQILGGILMLTLLLPWVSNPKEMIFIWDMLDGSGKKANPLIVLTVVMGGVGFLLIMLGSLKRALGWRSAIYGGGFVGAAAMIALQVAMDDKDSAKFAASAVSMFDSGGVWLFSALILLGLGCDLRARFGQTRVGQALIALGALGVLTLICLVPMMNTLGGDSSAAKAFWLIMTSDLNLPFVIRLAAFGGLLIIPLSVMALLGLLPSAAKPFSSIRRLLKGLSIAVLLYAPSIFIFIFLATLVQAKITLFMFSYMGLLFWLMMQTIKNSLALFIEGWERERWPLSDEEEKDEIDQWS